MLAVESLCDEFTLDDFSMRTQPFIRLHHFSAKREIYLRNLQIWVDEELVSCSRIKCLLWKFWIPENHNQVSLMRGKIPLRSDGIEMVCLFAIGREQSAKTTMTHWMYTLNHGERYHICWYIRERMTQSVVWHHISQLSPTKTNLFEAPPELCVLTTPIVLIHDRIFAECPRQTLIHERVCYLFKQHEIVRVVITNDIAIWYVCVASIENVTCAWHGYSSMGMISFAHKQWANVGAAAAAVDATVLFCFVDSWHWHTWHMQRLTRWNMNRSKLTRHIYYFVGRWYDNYVDMFCFDAIIMK